MQSAQTLGKQIVEQQLELSQKISVRLSQKYNNFLQESNLEDETIVHWRAKLIGYIGSALISFHTDDVWSDVTDWAVQTGRGAVQYGVAIDELLSTNKVYRSIIWEFLQENLDRDITTIESILKINNIIDTIMDQTAYVFSVSFVEHHKKTLGIARKAFMEVSTPVVALSDEIAILPLIGELDTDRATILIETSLERCAALGNTELIIDLSGVPMIDTMVASELFRVANALTLLGVRPTFTGLRPEIAQAVVNLGIDFKKIQIMSSLKQAIAIINKM
ncbi:STAS domain-containing protein [Bacillus sp. V59.32b]|uniref:STAS domain-containing protein n=1 Tax=Bacillus sp. V59.32b TaxID=1758642 RepID=UPI000E3D7834|nr:STAS domain-containing protein [Bacillus sp. V59.32b]RFU69669.1 STAS domain-containing protein [Bacillus sp. V59.32b]